MPLDPKFRTTVVQAFAVTMVDRGSEPPGSVPPTEDFTPSSRGPSMLPDVGHIVGGLYRLGRLLGQGMFGKVYVAQRVDVPEHQVALKLLPRSLYASRNVERELVMLATVGHPHVVQLKDHGMTADYVWLTMPVYEGETLAERLERGPLKLREAYEIFLPVARGLDALHAAGLRHQDVKPDNIFLAKFAGRLHPILLDLGVAAEREAAFCAGTALFAAPEQIRALHGYPGAVPLSEKMDTYGLATTLLYSLVEPTSFPGEAAESRTALGEAHEVRAQTPLAAHVLPTLEGRPRELLQAALQAWLALEQDERPSMSEMAEQLEVLLEPEREAAREEERLRARQKASLLRVRIAAFALMIIGCAVVLLLFSKRETLRLAGELDAARRRGAESFDKLDTCVASHRLAKADADVCRAARSRDRADFDQTLGSIQKSGSSTASEHAQEIQSLQALYSSRLKACEEGAEDAEEAALAERDRLLDEWSRERAALTTERDEARALAAQLTADLAVSSSLRDGCAAERDACGVERDRCQTAANEAAVYPPPAPPPPPPPRLHRPGGSPTSASPPLPPASGAAPADSASAPPPSGSPPAPAGSASPEIPSTTDLGEQHDRP